MEAQRSISPSSVALGIIFVVVCVYTARLWFYGSNTVPVPTYITGFTNQAPEVMPRLGAPSAIEEALISDEYFKNPKGSKAAPKAAPKPSSKGPYKATPVIKEMKNTGPMKAHEGFVARGSGSPDCLRKSLEGSQLVALFHDRVSTVSEGAPDLKELTQIVSKLSCFKSDLINPSYTVEATRYQPFVTMHDIEPIAETTGRCFAKTIPPRDLELAFDKWTARGELIIRRLCTAYQLNPEDVDKSQGLFRALIGDVKDIARGACLQGEPMIAGKPGPRDPHQYENPDMVDVGTYTGYY